MEEGARRKEGEWIVARDEHRRGADDQKGAWSLPLCGCRGIDVQVKHGESGISGNHAVPEGTELSYWLSPGEPQPHGFVS